MARLIFFFFVWRVDVSKLFATLLGFHMKFYGIHLLIWAILRALVLSLCFWKFPVNVALTSSGQ